MRRLCVTLILSTFLPLMAPAHADAFWRWLDELSGPGSFHGVDVDIRILCFATAASRQQYESELMDGMTTRAVRSADDGRMHTKTFAGGGVATPCIYRNHKELNTQRKASLNVAVGYQLAHHTNLDYGNAPVKERSVYLVSIRPAGWWRPKRWLEVGGGFGLYRFKGTDAKPFWEATLEPQVDIKPFALFRDGPRRGVPDAQYDELLSVRVGLVKFLNKIQASDFGAASFKNGSAETSRETVLSISIFLDLEPAFRMKSASDELARRYAFAARRP